jgi:hypothetical protein
MSGFGTVFAQHEYVTNFSQNWWNAKRRERALSPCLITGQLTVDSLLSGMDAAWKQGPT